MTLGSNSAVGGVRVMISGATRGRTILTGIAAKTYVTIGNALIRSIKNNRTARVRTSRVRVCKRYSPVHFPLRGGSASFRFLEAMTRLHPHAGAFKTVCHMEDGVTCTVRRFFGRGNFICIRAPLVATSSYRNTKRVFHIAALSVRGLPEGGGKYVSCAGSFFKGRADLAIDKRLRNRLNTLTLKRMCAFNPAFHTRGSGAPHRLTRF